MKKVALLLLLPTCLMANEVSVKFGQSTYSDGSEIHPTGSSYGFELNNLNSSTTGTRWIKLGGYVSASIGHSKSRDIVLKTNDYSMGGMIGTEIIENLTLFTRFGLAYSETKLKHKSNTLYGAGFNYGAGAKYNMSHIVVGIEYQATFTLQDAAIADNSVGANIGNLYATIGYSF